MGFKLTTFLKTDESKVWVLSAEAIPNYFDENKKTFQIYLININKHQHISLKNLP